MTEHIDKLVVRSHVARDLLQSAALFKTDRLVVWEYVVNGLQYVDPGVNPLVRVTLDSKRKRITVADNGRGMDWDGLQNFFIMHGENIDRKEGRPGRGRFGTGKSAAFGIASVFTIASTHHGKRSKVRLDRAAIEAMDSADEIPVDILERELPTNDPSGTVVRIDGVHLKSLDQPGIIRYIERHLARSPKNSTVIVNNHECEWQEPPVREQRSFSPEGELSRILGDVELVVKTSKTPLEEGTRGISIYSKGIWHETTLAGSEGREMSQFIFGDIDVPKLEDDDSLVPPFDITRSMRLNSENEVVRSIYAFVGRCVDIVRRELAEEDRQRRRGEEAKELARQASDIADLINEDFKDFRRKLAKVKARASGGADLHDTQDAGAGEDDLFLGGDLAAEIVSPTGGPGHSDGVGRSGSEPPDLGPQVRAKEEGEKVGRATDKGSGGRRPRGGFSVDFENMGEESSRAQYVREQRVILINLDHPQLVAARGIGSTDEVAFRRLSYEVAFSEYAIALASELAARDEYLDPSDPIVDIRDTINRLARKGARLYESKR